MSRGYRFGECELDEPRFELRRRGEKVRLQPKALDVLLYLVRHRARIVPRTELLAELWRGVVVTDDSLDKAVRLARQAIGDAGCTQQCIQTVRGRGFRFVAPVAESEAVARKVWLQAPADWPDDTGGFVGRADILAAIAAALAAAAAGKGRLVLLGGDAGMGKSRTAQEAAARARATGTRVLAGWCQEEEGAPSLWPWLCLLRPLVTDPEAAALLRDLGDGVLDLAERLPGLRVLPPAARRPALLEPAHARFRLLATVTEILKRAASSHDLLLILDDFHWADRASLSLLGLLAREVAASRLTVLVTYRPDDLSVGHPLVELARRPECVALVLAGLGRDEVRRLVESVLDAPADGALVDAIHERTQGNPFFVRELTRALASAGPGPEPATPGTTLPLPAGVHQVLRKRLEHLSAPCRDVLTLAATLGSDLDTAILARAAGHTPERALALIDEAKAAHVLADVGGRPAFAHALIRETLLAETPAPVRVRLHWRVGEALRGVHGNAAGDHLGTIARHLCTGAPSGDPKLAADYARRAGAHAARLLACDEAAEHYARALEALSLLDAPDERARCELLLGLGEAQIGAGLPEEGSAALRQAADLARRLGLAEHLARAVLASGGLELSPDTWVEEPEIVARIEEALAVLPAAEPALRARLLVRLGIALTWSNELARAAALVREAVATARRLGDATVLARALYAHRWGLLGPRDLPARLGAADEMLVLARRARDRELELAARSCRFLDLVELGRIVEADRELTVYRRLAAELRVPRYRWRAQFYRGLRLLLEGRFADAEALAHGTLTAEHAFRPADAGLVSSTQLFIVRVEQGRSAEIEPALRDLADRFPNVPTWRAALALVHAELGRATEAEEALERLATESFRTLPRNLLWVVTLVHLSEVATHLDDRARAAALYRLLRPYAPRTVVLGAGVACVGALDLYLGRLAMTAGDRRAATRHLATALAMNTRIGARPWIAWTRYELARSLWRGGRGTTARSRGSADRARRHLEHARAIAGPLGMTRLALRADALGADLG